ncbi:MAG: TetR/AcrR family transcriptional regulator [Proteobacteria bacterium]|nr:TetR/AcrR family transcriptional regulator [Pseudomonadota bacterium]
MPKPRSRSTPGRRARRPDSDARGQLLDAAVALFAERGIANTTVAQIGAAAGVTAAMVHYWFDTRERLLEALVEERLAPRFNYVWDQDGPESMAPLALAERVMGRLLEVTGQMPALPSLWLREVVNEGGLLREQVLRRVPMQRVAQFSAVMAAGQARGELNPDIEPSLIFISLLALVMLPQATAKTWRRVNPQLQLGPEVLQRHVAALLMRGLQGSGARAAPGAGRKHGRTS